MDAEPPQHVDGPGRDRRPAGRALWCAVAGIVGGLAIAIAAVLGEIGGMPMIMLSLVAAGLFFGGLTVALMRDPEIAERLGFRAGFTAGSLRMRWRSRRSRQRKDRS